MREVSAELAEDVLQRLRVPRALTDRVVAAIRHHMYDYELRLDRCRGASPRPSPRRRRPRSACSPCAAADNAASGVGPAGDANQAELEARIAEQLEAEPALLVDRRLAIDGDDLQRELGMPPGPEIGGRPRSAH